MHVAGDFYDLEGFRAGDEPLRDFELAEVGDVTGKSLVHLQCHIGTDTLGWARHGAERVVGLDFSGAAVRAARDLAAEEGWPQERAAFVEADVHQAASALPEDSYDIVYTGVGALCWLPGIDRWAQVAASLVAPGGFLYLAEFHPLTDVLDDRTGTQIVHDYFCRQAQVEEAPGTYADSQAPTVHDRNVQWHHPLGDVVSALAAQGLRVDFLHEHEVSLFARFETFERAEDGTYRFPSSFPRVPLMYSLRASRPVEA